MMTC